MKFKRVRRFIEEDLKIYLLARGKKPFAQQIRETWHLYRMYHYPPYHYLKHGLFESSFDGESESFVPPELIVRVMDSLNPQDALPKIEDKAWLTEILSAAHIRVVPTLAILSTSIWLGVALLTDFS